MEKPVKISRIKVPRKRPKSLTCEQQRSYETFLSSPGSFFIKPIKYRTVVRFYVMASETGMRRGKLAEARRERLLT
ncbi:MAG: hypothetical protein GY866_32325 [Proteobacteria bacterium]|nr:hypothetical protein [Pseudomonadota bacterium]